MLPKTIYVFRLTNGTCSSFMNKTHLNITCNIANKHCVTYSARYFFANILQCLNCNLYGIFYLLCSFFFFSVYALFDI